MKTPSLTNEQKEWLLKTGWKKMTINQIAEYLNVRKTVISAFYANKDVQPMTHRDLIAKEVIDIYNSGEQLQIVPLAEKLGCSPQLIQEIIKEYNLVNRPRKSIKPAVIDEDKIARARIAKILQNEQRVNRTNASRPPAVYTQTGSPILDELRNIQTTMRADTLNSNI